MLEPAERPHQPIREHLYKLVDEFNSIEDDKHELMEEASHTIDLGDSSKLHEKVQAIIKRQKFIDSEVARLAPIAEKYIPET